MIHCQMCARWSGSTQSNTATRLIAHASASASRNRRFLCKASPSRAKMDEHGTVVTSRRRPRCAWPGVLPPAWAVVTGLEWARDAERCWCGATCPLRRRHTCRPRWWALLHRRPHLSSCSSPPVPSPAPPSYDMHTAPGLPVGVNLNSGRNWVVCECLNCSGAYCKPSDC